MKILTFYGAKEKDCEEVIGDSVTNQGDYESLPDLIARICRGEVRADRSYGYTLGVDDDSDDAFDACDDLNDVDIVPSFFYDESGLTSGISIDEPSQSKTSAKEANVCAPVATEGEQPSVEEKAG